MPHGIRHSGSLVFLALEPSGSAMTEAASDDLPSDGAALLLMLAYVEAECRRLGAEQAARHVAKAAALVPTVMAARPDAAAAPGGRPAGPLH
jgi:hypothetical protein